MSKNTLPNQYTLTVGAKGRLILPVALRTQIFLDEGDKVVIRVHPDGKVELEPMFEIAKR